MANIVLTFGNSSPSTPGQPSLFIVTSGTGPEIEVNNTDTADQTILNFVAGSGISIINPAGTGKIVISATGSGSSGPALEISGTPTSDQTVLDFIPGTGIAITNPTGGQLQISSTIVQPEFQVGGADISNQDVVNFEAGTGIAITNPTAGKVHIASIISLPTFEHGGVSNTNQTFLNIVAGTGIGVTNPSSGNVTIAITGKEFQVGGTPITDQTFLNLIAGTNVTIVNGSSGNVTISATGGGGGGSGTLAGDTDVSITSPANGDLLTYNSGASKWENLQLALTGDVTSTGFATTVGKIQGVPVNTTTPTDGMILQFNSGDSKWDIVGPVFKVETCSTGNQTLAAGASTTISMTMAKTSFLKKITEAGGKKFRLELYGTSAARTADAARPYTIPLVLGSQHSCYLDLYIDQSVAVTPFFLDPKPTVSNDDTSPATTIYATLTNIDTSSQTINVTISYVALEV